MIRLGVDFGGTKIEAAALGPDGAILARARRPNPGAYEAAVSSLCDLVAAVEAEIGARDLPLGVGAPGSISPLTGRIRNANSVWMNDRPFREDLERALGRPVRMANDANCMALSEASDGAGAGARVVFGAILGTGCGGGVVVDGRLVKGRNGVGGEWGHIPLPWPGEADRPIPACWCGRMGCLETYISGSGLARDYAAATGSGPLGGAGVVAAMRAGAPDAVAAFDRYIDRLGRALAVVVDLIDPDVIVLGGGLSNVDEIYQRVPGAVRTYAFTDTFETPIRPAAHGDSSGVRGAARLWPLD